MAALPRCLRRDFPEKVQFILITVPYRMIFAKIYIVTDTGTAETRQIRETTDYLKTVLLRVLLAWRAYAFCLTKLILSLLTGARRRSSYHIVLQFSILPPGAGRSSCLVPRIYRNLLH